jgi:hypothetical protein
MLAFHMQPERWPKQYKYHIRPGAFDRALSWADDIHHDAFNLSG